MLRDLAVRLERGVRRRLGMSLDKGTIAPFTLSEEQVSAIRSPSPGPFEQAFYDHKGRIAHKWTHYLPIYDRIIAPWIGKPVRMLEIGVNKGGSLEVWRTVLGSDATIFGVDIDPRVATRVESPNQVRIGSQDDPDFLRSVVQEMGGVDIVLDDGSHIGRHVIKSFETLFPLMPVGGVYVIEDLQTSYWPGMHEGGYRRKGTAVEYLKTLVDEINGRFHSHGTSELFREQIGSIQFFSAVAVIEKCAPKGETGHFKRGLRAPGS
ncbi:class I SAM-dependent methyltransferase [Sphingomonas gilva]|uniref:Class I SAM-dependent methyltransferase n=1 Tax=Sphingomonas gilva TaxID=2305907 RepID=A0A396RKB2_9SPHN|nr:class I SAM-dependent methyltransferase [Sphingomonas gilva]RHW16668.1 class I SAM-dependent methyltransferase [Sphingomonas gilva]